MWLRGQLKRSQPQDRKQIETHLHAVGGESRRRGEKPQGRNKAKVSHTFARRNTGNREPGVDSNRRNDEGANLWKTPREEVEQEIVQRLSTKASGRTAQRAEGGSRRLSTVCGNSCRWSLKISRATWKDSERQKRSATSFNIGGVRELRSRTTGEKDAAKRLSTRKGVITGRVTPQECAEHRTESGT
jgi:hypothetical protein